MAGDKLAWVARIILNLSQVTRRESELSWFCYKCPAASAKRDSPPIVKNPSPQADFPESHVAAAQPLGSQIRDSIKA